MTPLTIYRDTFDSAVWNVYAPWAHPHEGPVVDGLVHWMTMTAEGIGQIFGTELGRTLDAMDIDDKGPIVFRVTTEILKQLPE